MCQFTRILMTRSNVSFMNFSHIRVAKMKETLGLSCVQECEIFHLLFCVLYLLLWDPMKSYEVFFLRICVILLDTNVALSLNLCHFSRISIAHLNVSFMFRNFSYKSRQNVGNFGPVFDVSENVAFFTFFFLVFGILVMRHISTRVFWWG